MLPTPCVQIAVIRRQTAAELGGGLVASDRNVPLMTTFSFPELLRRMEHLL